MTLKISTWCNGTLSCHRQRQATRSPSTSQEVGDAIKDYLERGRPSSQVHEEIHPGL